ncbi:MAG TPA: alpha/beta hydrolase [Bryobacteraceae bacterium]|jgi:pimeloyl-ACP methyl ester carboxylesterase
MRIRITVALALTAAALTATLLFGQAKPARRSREVIRTDEASIEVIAEGTGPIVVLLPSLGRDSEEFDPVAERVAAAGFRVLRPQPRGYGGSVGRMTALSLHDLAKDLAGVIRHENAGPAILAGHAFGHFVAKMTAVDFPELTRAVILIGAAQKTPNPDVKKSVEIATDPLQPEAERLKNLKLVFFAPGNDPAPWLSGFHTEVRGPEIFARDATPQAEYWSAGTAPILDIQGADDPYRPPASRDEMVKEFGAKRVKTVLIPHAAHALIVEQPRAVADAIIAYARGLK